MFKNELILAVFEQFRMTPLSIDQYDLVGKQILDDKISYFVERNLPVEFSMMGVPFKSINNRDKVLGTLPDLGEQLMMQNFQRFNKLIQAVHPPGIKLHLVSDGFAFNNLMDVADTTVEAYEEIVKDMASIAPVQVYDMRDFYDRNTPLDILRDKLYSQFGITEAELERRIQFDADVNGLYKGMIQFMGGDLSIRHFDSGNQLQKAAKAMARKMMFANEAYSRLVQSELGDKIRLSMHPSINNGVKYSFQLIHSDRANKSPWHCAILLQNGQYITLHRKDAEAAGYELVYKDGRPWFFVEF